MKKLLSIFAIVLTASLLAVTACQSGGGEAHTPIPTKDLFPVAGQEEAPDDIMPVPGGGPAYLANVHQQGVENPWPPIDIADVIIVRRGSDDEVHITYRNYIETKAGETRNNIIKVIMTNKDVNSLSLYADDIPDGITLTDGMRWSGPSAMASVLVIEIALDVSPGEYPLEIGLVINGKDYRTIPCRIKVLE